MPITVNDRVIPDEAIAREAAHHTHAESPQAAAACALAARALLLDRAQALGLVADAGGLDDEASDEAIEALLAREAPVPEPTGEECRKYYDAHAGEFMVGEIVEASHILFAVMPSAPVDAIRRQAEAVLRQAVASPDAFGTLARQFSNCPSSAENGNLGQLTRGETVPEFERPLFESETTGVLPRLISTRYGFHIVRVDRRVPGRRLEFSAVEATIAELLRRRVHAKAAQQYVRILASRASVTGVDLGEADTPLLQ